MKMLGNIKLQRQRDGKYFYAFESLMGRSKITRFILSIIKILKEEISVGEKKFMNTFFSEFIGDSNLKFGKVQVCAGCSVLSHVQLFPSPPESSAQGIFQARILKWVAISYSRGSSWPRDWSCVSFISCIGWWTLCNSATWEAPVLHLILSKRPRDDFLFQGIFPTQGENPHLLHHKADSLSLIHQESHCTRKPSKYSLKEHL